MQLYAVCLTNDYEYKPKNLKNLTQKRFPELGFSSPDIKTYWVCDGCVRPQFLNIISTANDLYWPLIVIDKMTSLMITA